MSCSMNMQLRALRAPTLHASVLAATHRMMRSKSSTTATRGISADDRGQLPLARQTILVTGSTDGIGLHTACRLAEAGAHVLIHGRSAQRVQKAVADVTAAQRASAGGVSTTAAAAAAAAATMPLVPLPQGYVADLSSLAEIADFAASVRHDHGRLTGLINNAGVYEPSRRLSVDGHEMTWAVNVLAPFALTMRLLDIIDDQIVITASISAASSIDLTNLQQDRGRYSAHTAYIQSKLCDIILALRLASLLRERRSLTRVNTLDPGTVNTKMLLAGWGRIGMSVGDADATLDMVMQGLAGRRPVGSGEYHVGSRPARPPAVAEDVSVQRQLWDIWEHQTGVAWHL